MFSKKDVALKAHAGFEHTQRKGLRSEINPKKESKRSFSDFISTKSWE